MPGAPGPAMRQRDKDLAHEAYRASSITLIARTKKGTASAFDRTALLTLQDGFVAHTNLLQAYRTPLSFEEARREAMRACKELYPEGDGWFDHQVSLTRFDPHEFAEEASRARF